MESEGFGWDNEFPLQCVGVPAFAAAQHKVTNGEYLEFVEQGAPAPFFWGGNAGRRTLRGMFGGYPLPLHGPVYCTQQEARPLREWRRIRLPPRSADPRRGA